MRIKKAFDNLISEKSPLNRLKTNRDDLISEKSPLQKSSLTMLFARTLEKNSRRINHWRLCVDFFLTLCCYRGCRCCWIRFISSKQEIFWCFKNENGKRIP